MEMISNQSALLSRITQNPGKCGSRPCIRNMRIGDILYIDQRPTISVSILGICYVFSR